MQIENPLAEHGLTVDDVRRMCTRTTTSTMRARTHRFEKATVIMNRRELEYSASGLMGAQYPPEYVKHHIDRLHTPGALRLLDLDCPGPARSSTASSASRPEATPRGR